MLAHVERHGKLYKVIFDRSVACAAWPGLRYTRLCVWALPDIYVHNDGPVNNQLYARQPERTTQVCYLLAFTPSGRLRACQTCARFFQHLTNRTYEPEFRWSQTHIYCEMAISTCLSYTMLASTHGCMVCARALRKHYRCQSNSRQTWWSLRHWHG